MVSPSLFYCSKSETLPAYIASWSVLHGNCGCPERPSKTFNCSCGSSLSPLTFCSSHCSPAGQSLFFSVTPRQAHGSVFTHTVHVNRLHTGTRWSQICARFSTSYSSRRDVTEGMTPISTETGLTLQEPARIHWEKPRNVHPLLCDSAHGAQEDVNLSMNVKSVGQSIREKNRTSAEINLLGEEIRWESR